MGPIVEIRDPVDPRLDDYVALTDMERRTRSEPEAGIFIAESALVIERAAAAAYPARSFLVSPRWLSTLAAVRERTDAPTYVGSEQLLEAVTGFHVHRGALGSYARTPLPAVEALLGTASRLVVLEGVNTHTNLGAIFRNAAALGMDAVLLSPSCTDPLYRRAVRVSMGAVFALPYARSAAWPDDLTTIRDAGYRLLALTPDLAAVPLDRITRTDRVALMLGAEGPGLSAAALAAADDRVCVPMRSGVDSLNVATAAALACYVVGRGSS